jgi:hypothetical protein
MYIKFLIPETPVSTKPCNQIRDFEGVATTSSCHEVAGSSPPVEAEKKPEVVAVSTEAQKKGGFCEKKCSFFFIGFTGKNDDNLGENLGFSLQFQELVVFLPQIGRAAWTNRYEEHVDLQIFSKIRVEHG